MSSLVASNICKSYRSELADEALDVLVDVNLSLSTGESLAIVGPSGSGKSTLLAILGTLDGPTSGEVLLDGRDPFQLSEAELARFRGEQIGFIFQDHHLLPQCTALENVLVPLLADGAATPDDVRRAEALLAKVGLTERQLHRPAQLSGGEKQRVAIARALIREPTLVLADEPTGNLDQTTAEEVARLLTDLQQQTGTLLIVATHSELLADRLARRAQLTSGRLEVKR